MKTKSRVLLKPFYQKALSYFKSCICTSCIFDISYYLLYEKDSNSHLKYPFYRVYIILLSDKHLQPVIYNQEFRVELRSILLDEFPKPLILSPDQSVPIRLLRPRDMS